MKEIKFYVNRDVDLSTIHDSMEIDSDTVLALLQCGDTEIALEVVGEVMVRFNKDGGDPVDGECYGSPSEFPEELLTLIKTGDIWYNPSVNVTLNNWFEMMCEDRSTGRFDSYVVDDAERKKIPEQFEMLYDSLAWFMEGEKTPREKKETMSESNYTKKVNERDFATYTFLVNDECDLSKTSPKEYEGGTVLATLERDDYIATLEVAATIRIWIKHEEEEEIEEHEYAACPQLLDLIHNSSLFEDPNVHANSYQWFKLSVKNRTTDEVTRTMAVDFEKLDVPMIFGTLADAIALELN